MLGTILEISGSSVIIKLSIDINVQPNLIGLHVVFEDGDTRIVGEVASVDQNQMNVNIVGEIVGDEFVPGATSRPSFKSQVRLVTLEELGPIIGSPETVFGTANFGVSNVYPNYKINVSINNFFSNHFSIFGNSGSGKSCSVASVFQKLFKTQTAPLNTNLILFDAYGEYGNAFRDIHNINPSLNYKCYTTNPEVGEDLLLRIPVWLLDVDDLALLLDANDAAQLPLIEKMLKLVPILTGSSESTIKKKDDIIARAVQDIMLSGNDSVKVHDQVVAVLTKFNTPLLNLNTAIVQPGYTRTLKQCLFVDKTGKMQEMELVVEFIRGYILDDDVLDASDANPFYSLNDLELAVEFALISEGILKSDRVYDLANVIGVRLHTLATSENRHFFTYPRYVTRDQYIDSLQTDPTDGSYVQIVNFNINYVDDRIAKVMTKIISRMLFLRSSTAKPRGSKAYHIIIEEAHRYVQHDNDVNILGYNIFERIAKEGRKYGVFLALITQRPSELSDTCISQCANFIILKTIHPVDLKYIKEMVPNISSEIVLQLKNLKPGNCIAFGSAFKVPTSLYVDLPDPRPLSNNVDLETVWYQSTSLSVANQNIPQQQVMQQMPMFQQPINNINQMPSPISQQN